MTVGAPLSRILHGRGCISQISGVVADQGIHRPALIVTPRRRFVDTLMAALTHDIAIIDIARDHCPETLIPQAGIMLGEGCDGLIALGGGSAIGLAKALAHETALPLITIPTSFAGSALTESFGVTYAQGKRVIRSEKARAKVAIYDPALFDDFGGVAASASAFNAIAHAVDALFGDITLGLRKDACTAIRKIADELPRRAGHPADAIVEGAILAATILAASGAGVHHRLCHAIGGRYGTPHALTHAAILPYSTRMREHSHPEAWDALGHALGGNDPAGALYDAIIAANITPGLARMGVPEEALADLLPVLVEAGINEVRAAAALRQAWSGVRPT